MSLCGRSPPTGWHYCPTAFTIRQRPHGHLRNPGFYPAWISPNAFTRKKGEPIHPKRPRNEPEDGGRLAAAALRSDLAALAGIYAAFRGIMSREIRVPTSQLWARRHLPLESRTPTAPKIPPFAIRARGSIWGQGFRPAFRLSRQRSIRTCRPARAIKTTAHFAGRDRDDAQDHSNPSEEHEALRSTHPATLA